MGRETLNKQIYILTTCSNTTLLEEEQKGVYLDLVPEGLSEEVIIKPRPKG